MAMRRAIPPTIITSTLLLWLIFLFLSLSFFNHSSNCNTKPSVIPRKLLLSTTKSDSSVFNSTREDHHHHHHHQNHHHHHKHVRAPPLPGFRPKPGPDPSDEIDPRYGVQKRLVPTGPNPLHH